MLTRRSWFVYGALLTIWVALIGWQIAEHFRVRRSARTALINRAKDTSDTLALLMRSQSFFGVISTNRLESALKELVKPGELHPTSVVLLNARDEELASAGAPFDLQLIGDLREGEHWDDQAQTVMLMNLVDLGTNIANVVLSPGDLRPPGRSGTNGVPGTNGSGTNSTGNVETNQDGTNAMVITNLTVVLTTNAPIPPGIAAGETNGLSNTNGGDRGRRGFRRRGDPERPFERPYWMNEAEYSSLIQKKGVHGFIVVMPTASLIAAVKQDLWLRAFITLLATISAAGYGLAWGNLAKTSELQIRLVRASELNSHLKEMNLAAAGLAHETRNPLNIVRGLAQMISKREDASIEIRGKSREIIDETDRITAQLNEFINYSRPREVRRGGTNLNSVVAEVVRALNYDIDEKKIQMQIVADPLTIEADEQLLRQALFNLVLNATQAVSINGSILIRAGRRNGSGAYIEVADNGPGVAPEHRVEIFKPYFTTQQEGTGLGLAVVQQIILAHSWEIECLANQPKGAIFRITHIKAYN